MKSRTIRIGTRDSELALWQANEVKSALEAQGYSTVLVPVKAEGDLNLDQPLYELGITGIFTKTLDIAMLSGKVDIAVHSMKDVPTLLPKGIVEGAVLTRASSRDLLLHKGLDFLNSEGTIATGSLRRKSQWLHRYPEHKVVDLRGNVNTRLKKLTENNWNGAIFAEAGLERINLKPGEAVQLDWMIPAAAQGAMLVVTLQEDQLAREALSSLHHEDTALCVQMERDFLRTLEGGCTAPIGALAEIKESTITFKGVLSSLDGKTFFNVETEIAREKADGFGKKCAEEILAKGGRELMHQIRKLNGK